ncbi:MAG: hypothetical protein MRZ79_06335 [Bacteroidia bacterium]|nr:hypothetical protein [Bacteroidia bacterium]
MNWFTLKLQIILILALGISPLFAQNLKYSGMWSPSNDKYPNLIISSNQGSTNIHASGGFIGSRTEALRFQQVASNGNTEIQVIFPGKNGNINLKLQFSGENLRATWSKPEVSGQFFRTVYSKDLSSKNISSSRGTIKGEAVGKAKSTASIFQVSLYGPDNNHNFISTQSLGKDGGYNFDSLKDGEYWLYIESRGNTIIEAFPAVQKVMIQNGNASVINIELK